MFYNSQLGRGLYGVYEINTELLQKSIKDKTLQNRLQQLYENVDPELVYKAEQAVSKCSIDCGNFRNELINIKINNVYEKYVRSIRKELPETKGINVPFIEEIFLENCLENYFERINMLLEHSGSVKRKQILQDFTKECEREETSALKAHIPDFDVTPMCQFVNRLIFANPVSFKNTEIEEQEFTKLEIADLTSFKGYKAEDCEAIFKTLKQFGIIQTPINSVYEYVYEPYQVYASYLQLRSDSLDNPLTITLGCGHHAVNAHELERLSSEYPSTGECKLCNHAISEDGNNLMINIYDKENPDIIWDAFKDRYFYQELRQKKIDTIADHTGFHMILDEKILSTLHGSISSGTIVEVSTPHISDELRERMTGFTKFGLTLLGTIEDKPDYASIYLQKQ